MIPVRYLSKKILPFLLVFFILYPVYRVFGSKKDYSQLIEFIRLEDREKPFYVFNNFEPEPENGCVKASLEYFKEHQPLVNKIREDLHSSSMRWELKDLNHRLLFVPETRYEFAELYEKYCIEVLSFILEKTSMQNPYKSISTLNNELPDLSDHNGVKAFLVHNLAREYNVTCIFFSPQNNKVKIKLNGKILIGEVGSYTTDIYLHDDGSLEFVRNNYTIWQNSARNPYIALMTPVEETLHILLREHTENMVREDILRNSVTTINDIKPVAEGWLAIEEAVVGGIVANLLPCFLEKYFPNFSYSLLEEDLQSKNRFAKYRYLKKGIGIVEKIGYMKAIKMYQNDTAAFKKLLVDGSIEKKEGLPPLF